MPASESADHVVIGAITKRLRTVSPLAKCKGQIRSAYIGFMATSKKRDSQQQYDDAQANWQQAQADAQMARINVQYTQVLSPISGRIGRSSVTEGALVTNGQAQELATVTQLDPIYVDVTQPITKLLGLQRAMADGHLQNSESQAEVSLALDDGSPYPLKAR